MDPISIAAGAAGLAVTVATLGRKLAEYGEMIASADGNLKHLTTDLATLGTTLTSIDLALRNNKLENVFEKATSLKEVNRHMSALQQILDDCRVAVQEFEAILESLKKSRFSSSLLRKSTTAWKINQKTPQLSRIQQLISGYHRAMQIHLQLMTLLASLQYALKFANAIRLLSTETTVGIQNIDASLDGIKSDILRLRFHITSLNEDENLDGQTLTSNSIKQSLAASEHVLSSTSEYFGSTAGTIRINNTSPVNFDDDRAAKVREWIEQKHEGANVETGSNGEETDDEEDTEMISELASTAQKFYDKGDLSNAKRFFGTFLQKVNSQPAWNQDEITNARVGLATCYSADREFIEAQLMLEKIDIAGCSQPQIFLVHQNLAEILYMNSELTKAKRYAKLAMKGRNKEDKGYFNSVILLVLICDGLDQTEEAEVYKARVPASFQPSHIPGFIAVEKNTQRSQQSSIDRGEVQSNGSIATAGSESNTLKILDPLQEEVPSDRTSTATNVTFINRTKATRIAVYWIDWDMNAKHYVDVDAGQSNLRPTYIRHVWKVVDRKTSRLIAIYVAQENDAAAIITDDMELKPLEKEVFSGYSSHATTVTFVNHTTKPLLIYWIDWKGEDKLYDTVYPEKSSVRPTYASHVWRVTCGWDHVRIGSYVAPLGDHSTVTINEESRLKAVATG